MPIDIILCKILLAICALGVGTSTFMGLYYRDQSQISNAVSFLLAGAAIYVSMEAIR